MMGIHDANNQNATNKNCNAFFIIPPTINVQLHLNTPQFGRTYKYLNQKKSLTKRYKLFSLKVHRKTFPILISPFRAR